MPFSLPTTALQHILNFSVSIARKDKYPGSQAKNERDEPSLDIIFEGPIYTLWPLQILPSATRPSFTQTTMSSLPSTILLLSALLILLPSPARAFGAGEIPDFSYLNGEH